MECPQFDEQVLAKLPPKMREELELEEIDVGTETYKLLSGHSMWL